MKSLKILLLIGLLTALTACEKEKDYFTVRTTTLSYEPISTPVVVEEEDSSKINLMVKLDKIEEDLKEYGVTFESESFTSFDNDREYIELKLINSYSDKELKNLGLDPKKKEELFNQYASHYLEGKTKSWNTDVLYLLKLQSVARQQYLFTKINQVDVLTDLLDYSPAKKLSSVLVKPHWDINIALNLEERGRLAQSIDEILVKMSELIDGNEVIIADILNSVELAKAAKQDSNQNSEILPTGDTASEYIEERFEAKLKKSLKRLEEISAYREFILSLKKDKEEQPESSLIELMQSRNEYAFLHQEATMAAKKLVQVLAFEELVEQELIRDKEGAFGIDSEKFELKISEEPELVFELLQVFKNIQKIEKDEALFYEYFRVKHNPSVAIKEISEKMNVIIDFIINLKNKYVVEKEVDNNEVFSHI